MTRIVSQDRLSSVDFENTAFIRNGTRILARISTQDMIMGEYATSARAAEVKDALDNCSSIPFAGNAYYMPEE